VPYTNNSKQNQTIKRMKANHNVLAALVVSLLMAFSPVSAHGNIFDYSVSLDGPSDGNASPGTGFGSVSYDSTAHTLQLQLSFTGLQGTTTASHIHAPTAASAVTPALPRRLQLLQVSHWGSPAAPIPPRWI
jgi:hypothetical protein